MVLDVMHRRDQSMGSAHVQIESVMVVLLWDMIGLP